MDDFDETLTPDPEPDELEPPYLRQATMYRESTHPVNWELLTSDEVEAEWLELNGWVDWLRRTYGLPASVIPPFWHRHPELVWELSALHLHWLGAYDQKEHAAAPIGWLHDFSLAQARLREWVSASGTKLDRDRPTRQTVWPGETTLADVAEMVIQNRDADFVQFVLEDVARRRAEEDEQFAADAERYER